jgi:outer membrane protein assembly factor BamB
MMVLQAAHVILAFKLFGMVALLGSKVGVTAHPWGQFGYDSQHTGRSPNNGPTGGAVSVAWQAQFGTGGAMSTTSIVVGSNGWVYTAAGVSVVTAVSGSSGAVQWNLNINATVGTSLTLDCTGALYFGDSNGNVYSVNANTGSILWVFPGGTRIGGGVTQGFDGTLYTASCAGVVYALDRSTGYVLWSYQASYGNVNSAPGVGPDGTVYVSTDENALIAVSNGKLLWTFGPNEFYEFYPTPTVGPYGVVYAGSWDYNMYAIRPDGSLLWSFLTGSEVEGSAAIGADGTVYFPSNDGNLYAVNGDTGALIWKASIGPAAIYSYSTPVIDAAGIVYVGSLSGAMLALQSSNGAVVWSFNTGSAVSGSAAIGANGMLFINNDAGTLFALTA